MEPSGKANPNQKKSSKKRIKQRSNKNIQQEDSKKGMPKRNLQIQVIEHPDANQKVEEEAVGDGSEYVESSPQLPSEQNEPNHRQGTLGQQNNDDAEGEDYYEEEYEEEEDEAENNEYADSMDDNIRKQSIQSFGQDSGRKRGKPKVEEGKIKQNATNGGIQAHHLNDFVKKSKVNQDKDPMNKTTKLEIRRKEEDEHIENQEIEQDKEEYVDDADEGMQDDELILKQQREAEELLEETK